MRNQKWVALSKKLEEQAWKGPTDPRLLRKQFFAGRALMRETNENIGDRTIHYYAIVETGQTFSSE